MSVEESVVAPRRPVFTPLHRWLGMQGEPMTFDLVERAVEEQLEERADLDYKATPPQAKGLAQSDLVKDLAAMANSGGGMLLFGVTDVGSRAEAIASVGDEFLTDGYLRDVRRVAINRISPPLLDLHFYPLRDGQRQALALVVPSSTTAPHLIFMNDSFRAPYRNGPDTLWMDERMLEAAYRRRFDARSNSAASLGELVERALEGRDTAERVWMVAAARPTNPIGISPRVDRQAAGEALQRALTFASAWTTPGNHPLEWLNLADPRPGLRSWRSRSMHEGDVYPRPADVEIHHDGTVVLAAGMGAARSGADSAFYGNEVASDRAERFVADFFGLVRASAALSGVTQFDIEIVLRWSGLSPIVFRIPDSHVHSYYLPSEHSMPIRSFRPVRASIDSSVAVDEYRDHLREVALDVVNQGGVWGLHGIAGPKSPVW